MADRAVLDQLRRQIASMESGTLGDVCSNSAVAMKADHQTKPKDFNSPDDAFRKIVMLINASDKSELAIRKRLVQAGFSQTAIEEAVERAKMYGIVNDLRYGEILIRSRISQGRGILGIERELRAQDIDINDVPGWPEDFCGNPDDEFNRAISVLESHPPHSKNPRDAAYRKLAAKGFSSSVASSAARVWHERIHT